MIILLFIIIPIIYCEWLWKRVLNKKKSYNESLQLLNLISIFIIIFALIMQDKYFICDVAYASTLLFYRLIVFPYRSEKNNKPTENL